MAAIPLDRVKRGIVARRPWWANCAILAVALLGATGLRLFIDGGQNGFPFLTFFPVVLLAAVFLGGGYAVFAAIAAVVIVGQLFFDTPWLSGADSAKIFILVLYVAMVSFVIMIGYVMRLLVLENEAHSRQQAAFNAELQHRTKNALQIMRALIARGPRGEDPSTYFETLAGRLDALAKANELLRFGVLESAGLRELVTMAVAPFDPTRFTLDGPACRVSRQAATPLMMALHELCTNATKYGALSADEGTVAVRWQVPAEGLPQGVGAQRVGIVWEERGGPAVVPPTHRGLGSRLLTANGGLTSVELEWRNEGLVCRLAALGASAQQ